MLGRIGPKVSKNRHFLPSHFLFSIGLCGDADGNKENDWIPRNAPDTITGVDFYQFVDSWKVKQGEGVEDIWFLAVLGMGGLF